MQVIYMKTTRFLMFHPVITEATPSPVFILCRVPAGRLTTMCSGTTTTSLQMNCRSSHTSSATPMCAAPGQFPSQHQPTTRIWWLSVLAITWWTKSTTGKDSEPFATSQTFASFLNCYLYRYYNESRQRLHYCNS